MICVVLYFSVNAVQLAYFSVNAVQLAYFIVNAVQLAYFSVNAVQLAWVLPFDLLFSAETEFPLAKKKNNQKTTTTPKQQTNHHLIAPICEQNFCGKCLQPPHLCEFCFEQYVCLLVGYSWVCDSYCRLW